MNPAWWRLLATDFYGSKCTHRQGKKRRADPGRSSIELLEKRLAPAGIALVQNIGTASVYNYPDNGSLSSLTLHVGTGHAVKANDTIVVELALNPDGETDGWNNG